MIHHLLHHRRGSWLLSLIGALAIAIVTADARGSVTENSPPPPATDASDVTRKTIWDESIDAGMNARYWSTLTEKSSNREWLSKVFAVVTGIASIGLPWLLRDVKQRWVMPAVEIASILALALSVVALLDNGANGQNLSTLEKRWNSLATQWNDLFRDYPKMSEQMVEARIEALRGQRRDIENCEPSETDHDLLHKSWIAEMYARDQSDWVKKQEAKRQPRI
jgi:hypothetical protein